MFNILRLATKTFACNSRIRTPSLLILNSQGTAFQSIHTQNKYQCSSQRILKHKLDHYKSATIDSTSLPDDPIKFDQMLKETMEYLRESKVRGVWLSLDLSKSTLIPTALKQEFTLHHAKTDYVLLSHWIPKDEPNMLPHYATHFVGIGGAVIREDTNEVLVIQEKISLIRDYWKIPGGLVNPGELLSKAAEREVFEETGIRAEFQQMLAFREKLVYRWNQPDIYFVALLKPLNFDINIDPNEVKESKWMNIEEYLEKDMIVSQKKISQVLGFHTLEGKRTPQEYSDKKFSDMFGLTGEEFSVDLGLGVENNNVFYCANVIRDWAKKRSSNSNN